MANLLGQNIGTNYKGILNLNTLNGNLSGTLQAVTDGDGNASPLQLSTTQVNVDSGSATTGYPLVVAVAANTSSGINIKNRTSAIGLRLFSSNGSTAFPYIGAYDGSAGGTYPLTLGVENSTLMAIGATNVGIGLPYPFTTSARLHVRGDGTNPILRLESTSGTQAIRLIADGSTTYFGSGDAAILVTNNSSVAAINGASFAFQSALTSGAQYGHKYYNIYSHSWTSGTGGIFDVGSMGGTFAAAAGSGNFRPINIAYTINNSGAQTGTATGIFLNATETALNGMTHNLMDLQVGGVSQFSVDRVGSLTTTGRIVAINSSLSRFLSIGLGSNFQTQMSSVTDGVLLLTDGGGSSFGRIQLGGTTNAFPAIKRNGAAIDFRLADDSDFTQVNASSFKIGGTGTEFLVNTILLAGLNILTFSINRIYIDNDNRGVAINNNLAVGGGNVATNASAALEVISTTKGFLPPRMTTTQKNAISTPATGLVLYDTTLNKLAVYTGSAWETVTSL
jgi:hypothetical protein